MAKERTTEARGPEYLEFGANLTKLRKARGLSQSETAAALGITQGATFHHASTIRIFRCICWRSDRCSKINGSNYRRTRLRLKGKWKEFDLDLPETKPRREAKTLWTGRRTSGSRLRSKRGRCKNGIKYRFSKKSENVIELNFIKK